MSFIPFLDAGESVQIDDLTIENGTERIALYGRLEIRRDRIGLPAGYSGPEGSDRRHCARARGIGSPSRAGAERTPDKRDAQPFMGRSCA
ncbi:hypothetical protein HKD27_12255 [Gluconobacter sp. R75690]|uniref:hypothetical protein n=1 Tax=unclassified Gluconobacter TaxID=2644261 RepID=UPI00188D957D|nr:MULTISPECIES: hypothetical protein [unclassified Gluconobacter]MBF0851681.1 hypothetical protein [Gluconobacter sp. R75690]MBF0880743.1 hypothetical protein [Gluconobacter sp. R75828]